MEITTIGLDIAKRVFQAHGVDASGKAVLRRKLQRAEVLNAPAMLVDAKSGRTLLQPALGPGSYRELAAAHQQRAPAYLAPLQAARTRGGSVNL